MERRKQYENGWKPFETIWKLYENNMERMWKGCENNMEMKWKWNFLSVTPVPADRQQPDNFHARTGHSLPVENSRVYKQLIETDEYARINEMKINYKKTKLMVFNPCTYIDFQPEWTLGSHDLEFVEEMRLLGIIMTSDLK